MEIHETIWEGDYADREPFLHAINEINSIEESVLVGLNLWWSDYPYDLRIFAQTVISRESDDKFRAAHKKINYLMSECQARQRTDITLEQLQQAVGQRQMNSVGAILGTPVSDPCRFPTRKELIPKGYDPQDWTAKSRVFLSHQNERKEEVIDLQGYLAGSDIPTWIDVHDIDYGQNLAVAVQEGIAQSSIVIFWVSEKFLKSNWCQVEFEGFLGRYSGRRDVTILTAVERGCIDQLPPLLQGLKYLELDSPGDPRKVAKEFAPAIRRALTGPLDKGWQNP
ncbi:toll/interleukin-1 receptor domain-containing protein [Gordonia alkaliphila]|uniref:TIR domain-containing protein n=1 Tax=Gordonia alkaliphila TaxID=1053547 RepID=A0ABP8ZKZ6_9ACTN